MIENMIIPMILPVGVMLLAFFVFERFIYVLVMVVDLIWSAFNG